MRDSFDANFLSFRDDYFSMLKDCGLSSPFIQVSQDDLIAALYRHARSGHVEPRFESLLALGPRGEAGTPADYGPEFVNKVRDHAMVEAVAWMEANPALVQEVSRALPDLGPMTAPVETYALLEVNPALLQKLREAFGDLEPMTAPSPTGPSIVF